MKQKINWYQLGKLKEKNITKQIQTKEEKRCALSEGGRAALTKTTTNE